MTAATKILERRARVWDQAKALADRAADENRNFTAEEQASWDGMNAEIDALDTRAQEIEAGEQADRMGAMEGRQRPADNGATELRSFLRGETRARRFDVLPSGPVNYRALSVSADPASSPRRSTSGWSST